MAKSLSRDAAYQQRYRHSDKGRATRAAYKKRIRERINAQERTRRATDPAYATRRKAIVMRYQETRKGRARVLFQSIKDRCTKSGLACTINVEWIRKRLDHGSCEVTNIPFDFRRGRGRHARPWNPSVDRKNPYEGYTVENAQVVCWAYNTAKGGWTHEDVLLLAQALLQKA